MKIAIYHRQLITCLATLAVFVFQSCDDNASYDVVGNPANIVYINTQEWTPINAPRNQYTFKITHTPVGDLGSVSAMFPVRSTKPMDKATVIKSAVDSTLIDGYNEKYSTACVSLPEGVINLSKSSVTISEGQYISDDSITVSIDSAKLALLTDSAYLVPIRLTSVSESDVQINSEYNTAYLRINTVNTLIKDNAGSADMAGSLVTDYSAWTVTSTPASTVNTFENIFDGSTATFWQFGTSPVTIIVDMNELKEMTGLRLFARYASYGTSYIFSKVKVALSKDNSTFEDAGTATSSTMANESGYQYIRFYNAEEARYIKLTLNWVSTYRSICELGVYTK